MAGQFTQLKMAEDVFSGMNVVTGGWESVAIWEKMRDLLTLLLNQRELYRIFTLAASSIFQL
jgi:hypothetical protein